MNKLSSAKYSVLSIGKIISYSMHTVNMVNDMILPQSTCITDFGVEVDHLLVFDAHIDKIGNKAKQRLTLILKCFKTSCFIG